MDGTSLKVLLNCAGALEVEGLPAFASFFPAARDPSGGHEVCCERMVYQNCKFLD